MELLQAVVVLIQFPFLALVPAAVFFYLYSVSKRRFILIVATMWSAYLPYEYAMKYRVLCTGECNIRVDLLLIYPLLIIASVIGVIIFAVSRRKNI